MPLLNNSFVLAWTPPYVIAASRLLTISLTVILSRKLPKARRAPSTTISRDCIPRSSAPTNGTDPYHSRLHSGITRRTGDKNTPSVFASFPGGVLSFSLYYNTIFTMYNSSQIRPAARSLPCACPFTSHHPNTMLLSCFLENYPRLMRLLPQHMSFRNRCEKGSEASTGTRIFKGFRGLRITNDPESHLKLSTNLYSLPFKRHHELSRQGSL